ncbi:MAG: N-acetylmuramic acid 6-phosphate etherase [Phycisphaerales bacterium]|nr:N-acetylmuramic acid 6-phosphate etherase [Phycisphaerales bacterium]
MRQPDDCLPPDRGHLETEHCNPRSADLDALSVRACVGLINDEDQTVALAVRQAVAEIAAFVETAAANMRCDGRLVYLGAGTSGRLGVLDASECPPTFQTDSGQVIGMIAGGDAALRRSSESMEDDPNGAKPNFEAIDVRAGDTVLGIAAGSTTPYVLGGLRLAKARGASTGLLCCSRVDRPSWVDHLIIVNTGAEVVTGSTRMKAGTATKMVLNTISTTIMVQLGKVHGNLMVDLRATNDKLRDRAARIVGELTGLDRDASLDLLDRAGGEVKSAVVMHRLDVTHEEAARRLADAHGLLRAALGEES